MKIKILTVLLSGLLLMNVSACNCVQYSNTTGNETEPNIDLATLDDNQKNYNNQLDEQESTMPIAEQVAISSNSIHEIRKVYFYEKINQNPYDAWLELKKAEGLLSEKEFYKDWLDLWCDELDFTIQSGKNLFSNEHDYLLWKTNLKQWLEITKETLRIEMNNMVIPSSLAQAHLIHHTGEIVRQKAIDTKYFLYKVQCDEAALLDSSIYEFPITWAIDLIS